MITECMLAAKTRIKAYPTNQARIYLLRHGETGLNALGVLQGSIEEPLNAVGRQQAQAAAQTLSGLGIERIISSPQRRARQTADIVAEKLHLSITEDTLLRERDWGIYEGRPLCERSEEGAGVEPFSSVLARAYQSFEHIITGSPTPCLAVAHSGLIKALLVQLCGHTPDVIHNGEIIQLIPHDNV